MKSTAIARTIDGRLTSTGKRVGSLRDIVSAALAIVVLTASIICVFTINRVYAVEAKLKRLETRSDWTVWTLYEIAQHTPGVKVERPPEPGREP